MSGIIDWIKKRAGIYDVSIIIAVYNHEKYLKNAIDSVLEQKIDCTHEVIIIDDFSTDSSRDILREMEPTLPWNYRIIYRDHNYGIVDNYYDGLQRARGRYFIILEADDYWTYPHKIQRQFEFLEKHREYLAVSHLHDTIDADGNKEPMHDAYRIGETYGLDDFLRRKLPGHTATILCRNYFRKKLFDHRIELKDFVVMDQVNAFMLAAHGKTYSIKETWSVYRHITSHGSSYSTLIQKDLTTSRYKDLFRGCCLYVREHRMDEEIVTRVENFYIKYLFDHWAAKSEDDHVTAEEVISEVKNIRDIQYGQQIIKEMEELQDARNRESVHSE